MNDNDIRRSESMKRWRRRDHYTCQLCHIVRTKYSKVKLHVHHIVRFTDDISKRFDITNGITLCDRDHRLTYGKEHEFEDQFNSIISSNGMGTHHWCKGYHHHLPDHTM